MVRACRHAHPCIFILWTKVIGVLSLSPSLVLVCVDGVSVSAGFLYSGKVPFASPGVIAEIRVRHHPEAAVT